MPGVRYDTSETAGGGENLQQGTGRDEKKDEKAVE